jgi:hypothetical protein
VLSDVHRASHLSGLALLQHSKAFRHMWLIHLQCTLLLVCYLSDSIWLTFLYVSCHYSSCGRCFPALAGRLWFSAVRPSDVQGSGLRYRRHCSSRCGDCCRMPRVRVNRYLICRLLILTDRLWLLWFYGERIRNASSFARKGSS